MKSFKIYPDKARALGNVMNTNSNDGDMEGVLCEPRLVLDGNDQVETVDYDNLDFPVFEIGVLESVYSASLELEVPSGAYVTDQVTITATLRDSNSQLLEGSIAFFCGNDCITGGTNTGNTVTYANTTNGTVSFNYSFDSMGEYSIRAVSLATNMHHSATSTRALSVSKKQVSFNINGINDSTYVHDIPFTVQLINNNQIVVGLPYSITLDGEEFDTGTSSNNGESYTINNLDVGLHNITFYFGGNTLYASCSETIEFHNGKVPDYMGITLDNLSMNYQNHTGNGNMTIAIYSETLPVEGMPVTVTITPSGINRTGLVTDSNGEVTFFFTGFRIDVDNTVTVVTSDNGNFVATTLSKQLSA